MSSLIGKPVKEIRVQVTREGLKVTAIVVDDTEDNEDCICTPYVDPKTGIALLKLSRKTRTTR